MSDTDAIFVVLGRDTQGKPHAARFSDEDAELAAKAADLMSFHAVRVVEPPLMHLAASLPLGRVFATGRAFVPFVKAAVFDRLAGLVEANGAAAEADGEAAAPVTAAEAVPEEAPRPDQPETRFAPRRWEEIGVGSLVLAYDGHEAAWYEAMVSAPVGEAFRLVWRDYPKEGPIVRRRDELALLCPAAA
jgi:hypothetical protein